MGLSRREEAPEHLAGAIPRAVSITDTRKHDREPSSMTGAAVFAVLEMRPHRRMRAREFQEFVALSEHFFVCISGTIFSDRAER